MLSTTTSITTPSIRPTEPEASEIPTGMLEVRARRGDHTVRVCVAPEGNARPLVRCLVMTLLVLASEAVLVDGADGAFTVNCALDGLHAFTTKCRTHAEAEVQAHVFCPTCARGAGHWTTLPTRTWQDLGFRAGDRVEIAVTGSRYESRTEAVPPPITGASRGETSGAYVG